MSVLSCSSSALFEHADNDMLAAANNMAIAAAEIDEFVLNIVPPDRCKDCKRSPGKNAKDAPIMTSAFICVQQKDASTHSREVPRKFLY